MAARRHGRDAAAGTVVITLLFADDAQASGMGGCNGYGATYP